MDQFEDNLMSSFTERRSRRSLLKGAAIGAAGITGLAAAGAGVSSLLSRNVVHAAYTPNSSKCITPIPDILTIGRTAERLAVTFYTLGLANHVELGLNGDAEDVIAAALVEEQIHELFFAANGGKVLTSTFSFPHGPDTFKSLDLFIETQQQLEGVFDSAFLAAIKEFAEQARPDLSQIAGQIATVEAEHRALGRYLAGLDPADNWAFSPVLLTHVGEAPAVVKKAGYLSPHKGNSYTYKQVSTHLTKVMYRAPYAKPCS